jgi:hypothetical protein
MAESIGTFDTLSISSDGSSFTVFEFKDGSSIGLMEQFYDSNGLRGSRQHNSARVRRGMRQVQGQLLFEPSAAEYATLISWIGDGSPTVPARYVRAGRDGTGFEYTGCKVAQATFSASEGGPLQVAVGVQGIDESSTTAPAGSAIVDGSGPFMLSDAVLSVGGSNYAFRQFSLTIDHGLETRFNNSLTPSSIHATDLNVQVSLGLPYGDASALYGSALAGVAVVLTFTNTVTTTAVTITLNNVAAPRQPLPFGGRTARTMDWTGVARRNGSTPPFAFS